MKSIVLFIIRTLGLKGSFIWAVRQMKKGKVIKPSNITGSVKYRFSKDEQYRLEWTFDREDFQWDNANFFRDDLYHMWEVVNS